uniref:Putative secreted protein n=1 Tax=Anopheles darlingi TaxID=43151 RepID=A0A2M4D7L0_ANODA
MRIWWRWLRRWILCQIRTAIGLSRGVTHWAGVRFASRQTVSTNRNTIPWKRMSFRVTCVRLCIRTH